MLVIGLTGGIASGKTLVSDTFAHFGAPVVDADVLARRVVAKDSEGLIALKALFGEEILLPSGELDRKTLRDIIFKNPSARAQVDELLHPLIRKLSEEQIEQHRQQQPPYLIHAIPLLVETQQMDRHDRIVVVDVPETLQQERLMQRDDTSAEKAMRIIRAQASREERLAIADDVIDNTGTIENTYKQVETLHALYCQLAA